MLAKASEANDGDGGKIEEAKVGAGEVERVQAEEAREEEEGRGVTTVV